MVTHIEYRELPPNDGASKGSFWSKLPAAMRLTLIDQNRENGRLSPKSYQNTSFKHVAGGWIHCGSTLSAWGTYLGSEEYEPDAKTREGIPAASGADDTTDIASFKWIRLGRSTDAEINALVDRGIEFSDIFAVSNADPGDPTYRKVATYNGVEWLRLEPGMEKAAAFLETRRYATYLGATTELSKMEYVGFNAKDRKFYVVISRIEKSMADAAGDIQVARNNGGGVYEMATATAQKDTIRTLLSGEDTGRRNNNYDNYVWAFNIDTRRLSRILSVPMAAEATGLAVVEDYDGFAYVMSNFQHPGEGGLPSYTGADKAEVQRLIDEKWGNRKKAAIGYLGTKDAALPKLR